MGISANGHFCQWAFLQMGISGNRQFCKKTFLKMGISANGHICKWAFLCKWTFLQIGISANGHFCLWAFLLMGIFANGHICKWAFLKIGIYGNKNFYNWASLQVNIIEFMKLCILIFQIDFFSRKRLRKLNLLMEKNYINIIIQHRKLKWIQKALKLFLILRHTFFNSLEAKKFGWKWVKIDFHNLKEKISFPFFWIMV